ncbi:MAG: sulfurtransferase [Acidimicrobiia bacterium]|nr:sulfurtransferase [Acidimicrobiia bacterium]
MKALPPIVSADWLANRLAEPGPEGSIVLADVRSYLDGRDGHAAYLEAHLPGAVFVDLDGVLAAPASPAEGRHPMPTPETFADGLGAAGIGADDPVVAYDDLGGMIAGRLVWMLRILGRPAALLDGGITAWPGPTEPGAVSRPPVERPVTPWPAEAIVSIDQVDAHLAAGRLLVDSRAPERYRGETEPIDPRAGHIPGAVNAPFADNLGEGKRFRSPEDLRRRFDELGANGDTVFYCGSGVSACNNVLAMEAAGHPRPRVFVGSWSQWSNDPDRPARSGDQA